MPWEFLAAGFTAITGFLGFYGKRLYQSVSDNRQKVEKVEAETREEIKKLENKIDNFGLDIMQRMNGFHLMLTSDYITKKEHRDSEDRIMRKLDKVEEENQKRADKQDSKMDRILEMLSHKADRKSDA